MQGSAAASLFASSSPAHHAPTAAFAAPVMMPPALAHGHQQHQQLQHQQQLQQQHQQQLPPMHPLSGVPTAAVQGAAPAGFAGSFSPSDASSIESEAEDLLNGIHGHISRQQLTAGTAAALLGRGTSALGHMAGGVGGKHAPMPLPTPADADGIDDVLRLQPWLNE